MKKSTLGDYKSLKRVLKYVLDTSDLRLVLMENGKKFNHLIEKTVEKMKGPLWRKFAKNRVI